MRQQCDNNAMDELQAESVRAPGVIVSGQGGSATRAGQLVVQRAGTHDFGSVSNLTGDSFASRWSGLLIHMDEDSTKPLPRLVAQSTGRSVYDPNDLDEMSHILIADAVCRTLLMASTTRDPNAPRRLPWAIKEPWVRLLLPFFDEALGQDGYKLVHVTRDVRTIHQTHGDEEMASDVGLGTRLLHHMVDKVSHLVAKRGTGALSSLLELDELDDVQRTALSAVDPSRLQAALLKVDELHEHHGSHQRVSRKDIQQRVMFAFMWGAIELPLKQSWQQERPQRYFHLSEKLMSPSHPKTARFTARRLARFLGVRRPSAAMLNSMTNVYRPMKPNREGDWELMQAIVGLRGMEQTRRALASFGYSDVPPEPV